MSKGWISLHRKLQDHPLWNAEKFSRGQAWVDLVLMANHKDTFFYKRGIKIEVKRGEIGVSKKGLSDRWRWSIGKVSRFLNDLENMDQTETKTDNKTTIVTICNYNKYQQNKGGDGSQTEGQTETKRKPNGNQTETYNNVNNVNNVNNSITSSDDNGDIQVAFDLYNQLADKCDLPNAQVLSDTRKRRIKKRLQDCGGIDGWKAALGKVSQSEFLTGKKTDFKASLDFILQKSSFIKIIEGNYDSKNGKHKRKAGKSFAQARGEV